MLQLSGWKVKKLIQVSIRKLTGEHASTKLMQIMSLLPWYLLLNLQFDWPGFKLSAGKASVVLIILIVMQKCTRSMPNEHICSYLIFKMGRIMLSSTVSKEATLSWGWRLLQLRRVHWSHTLSLMEVYVREHALSRGQSGERVPQLRSWAPWRKMVCVYMCMWACVCACVHACVYHSVSQWIVLWNSSGKLGLHSVPRRGTCKQGGHTQLRLKTTSAEKGALEPYSVPRGGVCMRARTQSRSIRGKSASAEKLGTMEEDGACVCICLSALL